jgi:DNA polymerase-3 subunit gamma/tau
MAESNATRRTSGDPSPRESRSGGYRVVARRYRPQRFADLIGQTHVARGLAGAITSGRIGHAYLFTGARGVGKTSAARIFAKALQCTAAGHNAESGKGTPTAEPCNSCEMCEAISAGQDVDVVEIDAASNRGIDEIRQLRQNAAVRPAHGHYKIYIIDEVHMLTREAFNALLKTLEEPPPHVKFVLCTTEPEKLPITILSRCQRFDFLTVEATAIEARLAEIAAAEGVAIDAEAVRLVARRANGSMRDSQSLLEQLLGAAAAADGRIGIDAVHALLGTGREEGLAQLVQAIASQQAKEAVEALNTAVAGGSDAGGVLEQLLAVLRDLMLASVSAESGLWHADGGCGIDVPTLAGSLGCDTILAMMQVIDQSLMRMRTAGHAAILAEMAVVRLASMERMESLSEVLGRLADSQPVAPSSPAVAAAASSSREKKTTDRTGQAEPERLTPAVQQPSSEGGQASQPEAAGRLSGDVGPRTPPAPAIDPDAPPLEVWRQIGEMVGGMAAGFINEATSAAWHGDDGIEVTMPATGETGCSFLKRPEVSASVTEALRQLSGRARFVFAFEEAKPVAAKPKPAASRSQAALLRLASEHPLVTHARTVFDAAIRRVDPPSPAAERAGEGNG